MDAGAQIVLTTLQLVLTGIGIGVLMAAPIGPVNVLVIQRTVAGGFWAGLAAGLGAVLGDGLLAAIAAFSVTAISDVMSAYSEQIRLLTITNPGAVLGMAAMIGGLGSLIGGLNTYLEALLLVAAVMGGSLLWWLGLSELIATIRHKLTEGRLKLINRIAGGVLVAFGLLLLFDGFVLR